MSTYVNIDNSCAMSGVTLSRCTADIAIQVTTRLVALATSDTISFHISGLQLRKADTQTEQSLDKISKERKASNYYGARKTALLGQPTFTLEPR